MNPVAAIRSVPPVAWAILAFTAWRSLPLLDAWRHSPLDRLGWLAFLVWGLPAALAFAIARAPDPAPGVAPRSIPPQSRATAALFGAALATALVGTLGDLNAASYASLALALAALSLPLVPRALPDLPDPPAPPLLWVMSALAWMPALSWLAKSLPPATLAGLRLGIALAGVLPITLRIVSRSRSSSRSRPPAQAQAPRP